MKTMTRTAESALGKLMGVATGKHVFHATPVRSRAEVVRVLKDATGASIGMDGCHQTLLLDGRPIRLDERDTEMTVAGNISAWMSEPGDEYRSDEPQAWPEGADAIIAGLEYNPTRVRALRNAIGWVALGRGEATVSIYTGERCPTFRYDSGRGSRWENGIVVMRTKPIPNVILTAMTGQRLGRMVDDPILADMIVRRIPPIVANEGRIRIITMDAGRVHAAY